MFQNRARAPKFEASGADCLFSAEAFLNRNKFAFYHEIWATNGKKRNIMDVYMCYQYCEKLKTYISLKNAKIWGTFHIEVLSRRRLEFKVKK